MHPVTARRALLRTLGLAAAGTAFLPAAAGAIQEIPSGDLNGILDQGCGSTSYHQKLVFDTLSRLGIDLTDQQRHTLLAKMNCPTCGCPLDRFEPASGAF